VCGDDDGEFDEFFKVFFIASLWKLEMVRDEVLKDLSLMRLVVEAVLVVLGSVDFVVGSMNIVRGPVLL
jgi:hypothetical protein